MEQFNFEEDVRINPHALDLEWLALPTKAGKYGKAHAQAILDRDKAQMALSVAKATLSNGIRVELAATSRDGKFTETAVEARMKVMPAYLEARTRWLEAEYRVNLLFSAVMAINKLEGALEWLSKLDQRNYYSEALGQRNPDLTARSVSEGVEAQREGLARSMQEGPPEAVGRPQPLKRKA